MRISSRPALSTTAGIVSIVVIIIVAGVASALILTQPTGTTQSSSSSTSLPTTSSAQTSTSTVPLSSLTSSTTRSMDKVSLILTFTPTEFHSFFYYGVAEGIYAKYGIDLTIIPGSGVPRAAAAVSTGQATFGEGDPGFLSYLEATQNISNVRFIASIHQRTTFAIICNKATVPTLKDLNGKTIGTQQGSTTLALLPAVAKLNNLNYSSFKILYVQPAQINSLMALGKTDCILQTLNALASIGPTVQQAGIQVNNFSYWDAGVKIYGTGLITSTDMINTNPGLVKRFVQATLESMVGSAHNPQQAIADLVKVVPSLNQNLALNGFRIWVSHDIPNVNSTTYSSNPLKLGWISASDVQSSENIIAQAFGVKNPPPLSQIYTAQFVEQP